MRKLLSILARFPNALAIRLIRHCWQRWLGPRYNQQMRVRCRFYPSCSSYSILAFEKYGCWKGCKLTVLRIRRCNLDNTESCVDFP